MKYLKIVEIVKVSPLGKVKVSGFDIKPKTLKCALDRFPYLRREKDYLVYNYTLKESEIFKNSIRGKVFRELYNDSRLKYKDFLEQSFVLESQCSLNYFNDCKSLFKKHWSKYV